MRIGLTVLAAFASAALVACGGGGPPPTPSPTEIPATATSAPTTAAPAVTTVAATATASPRPTSPATPAARPPVTAPPTSTRTPTVASTTGRVVSNGPRDVSKVALTFDMGGRVDPAVAIMDWLQQNRVQATIFMTGAIVRNQDTEAGRDVLRRIEARPDLFDIGSHSDTHPDFTGVSEPEMLAELRVTEAEIVKHLKASPRPFFRPPFGAQNAAVVAGAAKAGYPVTVMWDVDTIDWRPEADGGPTADQIVDKVLSQAKGGSIVLMHLGGFNTLDALPRLVTGLRERGFALVTLSELLDVPRE